MSLRNRIILYGAALIGGLVWLWFTKHHHDVHVDHQITSSVLPPQDEEKLIINQYSHTITEVTRNEKGQSQTHTVFYGPKSSVEIKKDGSVKVNTRTWGTELSPSCGIIYGTDTRLRGEGSLGLFYIQRFEFSVGVGMGALLSSTRALASVTYNVWDNVIIGGYVDHKKDAGVLVGFKF